ncbi:MAG: sporulation protein YqfD [Enterocloster sp.]
MREWLLHNWKGYIRLELKGYSPERFLNLCSARGIEIWGIKCGPGGDYRFCMTVEGYRRVQPLVRKAEVRLHILERFGLPFFIYRYKKRWYFAAGIAGFFAVLYIMSLFIWDIRFEGNYRYTYDTLLTFLESEEICYGMKKSAVDCDRLEDAIRENFPEITWVAARVSGTRLLIHVKENEVLSSVPLKDETPCDIVAVKEGIITSMIVRQGTTCVKVGDQVEEGQILVKGWVPLRDDSGTEIGGTLVRADADISARTFCSYEKKLPLVREVRADTGRRRKGWYLKAGPWSFTLLLPVPENRQWDYSMEEYQLKLFANYYLPFYLGIIEGKEMVSYEKNYTKKELEELASVYNRQFVKKLEEKGVQILENNDRIDTSLSQCRIRGELVTVESIVSTRPAEKPTTDSEETETAQ